MIALKVIIASDIHGNLDYTKRLYELCEREEPNKIILLGDLLNNYYYDDYFTVEEIINLMNRWSALTLAVKGNTDRFDDIEKLNFPFANTYDEIELDDIKFYYTHGHLIDRLEKTFKDDYVLVGHSHRYNLEGQFINPGSVGLPRYNKEHTCLIYDNKEFKLINLDDFTIIATKSI